LYRVIVKQFIPSSIVSVMQVDEGLVMFFITCEHISTKLCLNNFHVVGVLTNCLAIIGQTVVNGLVRWNLIFRNAEFIPKLMNNLCYVDKQ
jgi:hypothetical protein